MVVIVELMLRLGLEQTVTPVRKIFWIQRTALKKKFLYQMLRLREGAVKALSPELILLHLLREVRNL